MVGSPQAGTARSHGLPASIRRLLVVQTQRLGDVVVLTPTLTALRRCFPEAELDVLVHRPQDTLLVGHPDIDHVLTYDRQTTHRSPLARLSLARELRSRKYDWALVIHAASSVAAGLCLAGIRAKTCVWRYGPDRPPALAWCYSGRVVQHREREERHEVEHNLDVLRELGIKPDHDGLRLPVTQAEQAEADRILTDSGRITAARLAVLHAGHGGGRQCWSPARYAALGDRLAGLGMQVALTGAPKEVDLAQEIGRSMAHDPLFLAGKLSLRVLVAALARADVFVSVPTGPMHLAASQGVPVVALYGPSDLDIDRARFHPYGVPYRAVTSTVPCNCPGSHTCEMPICMDGISVGAVAAAVESLFAGQVT